MRRSTPPSRAVRIAFGLASLVALALAAGAGQKWGF